MGKKVIFLISIVVVLLLAGGGVFYWWQNQADVRELNKTLPEGIGVAKSLVGNEYSVVNKIDGYEFKVPPEWGGISEVEYVPEREEKGYRGTSIGLKGKEGGSTIVSVDLFKIEKPDGNLELWAKNFFTTFGLIGEFYKEQIGKFETIKTQENVHLVGMFVYFFQDGSTIYSVVNGSEEFTRYIITNGKW